MTPAQKEALNLVNQGFTRHQIAEKMNRSFSSVKQLLEKARRNLRNEELDPTIVESMTAIKTDITPALVWAKTKNENGTSFSVLLKPPQETPVDIAERIRDAFEGMTAAEPVTLTERTSDDLLTLIPLFDMHLGMHAWGKETGDQDYDLKLAETDLRKTITRLTEIAPSSDKAVLLIGGDFYHANDNNAETPQSKHRLDVDGRHFRVIDTGIKIIAETVENLLKRHNHVLLRVLRGNHDLESHLVLTFALEQRYRDEPRVTIEKTAFDLFMLQWGRTAIFAHHGDKMKPQQMAIYLSDLCPFWSDTKHRYALTGHVHHDAAKDVGSLRWESLRAFAPPDAYAASMGYGTRRALQFLTFHKKSGLVLRAIDPIERD